MKIVVVVVVGTHLYRETMVNIPVSRCDSSPVNISCVTNQVKLARQSCLSKGMCQDEKDMKVKTRRGSILLKDRYEKLLKLL